jgi:hypothetical protein
MDRLVCLVIGPPHLPDRSRNTALFRQVNERIRDVSRAWGNSDAIGFLCECGNSNCVGVVELPVEDFEAIRSSPGRFLVLREHETFDGEEVVATVDGYLVVERPAEVTAAAY